MTPDGKVLASNDDLFGKDAGLVFTPPADGDYVIRVRDLNNKGGDGFVYLLECAPARPDFTLKCDPSKAMIGPGSRTAWFVQVARTNGFAGPVRVEVEGLHDRVLERTPARRWGEAADFAGIAVFLSSAASNFITGVAIPVDGGYSSQA